MDVLIFIVVVLAVISALATLGQILSPLTNYLAPPPEDSQDSSYSEPADNEPLSSLGGMKRTRTKAPPPPAPRAMPDGMRALRELLDAQSRTTKP